MLVMMTADIAKPEGCSNKEFFEVWRKESVAAQAAAAEEGPIKCIWKVAGQYQIIAVMEIADGETIDEIVHDLPIWSEGFAHIVTNITWKPLSPYSAWAEKLEELARS